MSDIKDWADDADLNGEASPAGWPEGMPPSDVNNSAREMMAALRRSYVRQPWYAPGGEIVRASGTQITIRDDAKVTDYSQYYSINQRVRVEGEEYNVTGSVSSISYEAPTTTIEFELDAELPLPGTIKDVYVGLSPSDVQGVAGPNLLGCIIGFTEEASQIGAGLLHANGQRFSPSLYPDLARLYFMGNNSDGTPNYRYGREKVGNEWWPKRPDVRGYFPRFLDDRAAGDSNRVDLGSPRAVGSKQADDNKSHTHTLRVHLGTENTKDNRNSYIAGNNYAASAERGMWHTEANATNNVSIANQGSESRPKNIAVVGVIVAYGGVVAGGLADVSEVLEDVRTTKELAQSLSVTIANLGDVMRYMGSVATYDDLPTVDNQVGDVYNVLDTGANYAWTAAGAWDAFGGLLPDNIVLNNTSEETSLAIGSRSSATFANSLALGSHSQVSGQWAAAIGSFAKATSTSSLAIGGSAKATAENAIQIGFGTNSTPRSLQVSFHDMFVGGEQNDYVLLTGDGKIPVERLPEDIGGSGKVTQLGFNGVLEGGVLTFTPAEGSDTVYDIQDFYAYEIDLLFEAVGEIDDSVTMVIKNGNDTYNIVNVLHDDPTTAATVGDMKQIMKYSTDIGWRWIFNVRATTTQAGDKVLVMPSTVANVPDMTGYLQNTSKATDSVTIAGNASSVDKAVNVGFRSNVYGEGGTAVGFSASAYAKNATAVGQTAFARAEHSIQIGQGYNGTANTMNVGLSPTLNVQLLGPEGKIPAERLPDDIGGGYKSLDETQKTQLLLDGTYKGADVVDGEVFTEYDGKFVEFDKTLNPGLEGSYQSQRCERIVAYSDTLDLYVYAGYLGSSYSIATSSTPEAYDSSSWVVRETLSDIKSTGNFVGAWTGSEFVVTYHTTTGFVVATSSDGVSWELTAHETTDLPYSIGYGDGVLLLGSKTGIHRSTDNGKSFELITVPNSNTTYSFDDIVYGNSIFVTGKYNDHFFSYSTDKGLTWQNSDNISDRDKKRIAFGNGMFLATGNETYSPQFRSSTDGKVWTAVTNAPSSVTYAGSIGTLCFGNGYFLLTPPIRSGYNSVGLTTDGITWTTVEVGVNAAWQKTLYTKDGTFIIPSATYLATVKTSPYYEYSLLPLSYTKEEVDNTLEGAGYLKNTATGSESTTLDGTASTYSLSLNIGQTSNITGNYGVALGYGSSAANNSVALGTSATATGVNAVAIGRNAKTYGREAIGIGCNAYSPKSVAIGYSAGTGSSSSDTYEGATAIGYHAQSRAAYAIQLGYGTNSTANTLSVGLSDSLNVQLLDANGKIPAERLPDSVATAALMSNSTEADYAIAYGEGATAEEAGTSTGYNSTSLNYSVSYGYTADATGLYSVALGASSQTTSDYATAVGYNAHAMGEHAIQIGYGNNTEAHTMRVAVDQNRNFLLLDENGDIPAERTMNGLITIGSGAPTSSTEGFYGKIYIDSTNSQAYICVGDAGTSWTWKQITS